MGLLEILQKIVLITSKKNSVTKLWDKSCYFQFELLLFNATRTYTSWITQKVPGTTEHSLVPINLSHFEKTYILVVIFWGYKKQFFWCSGVSGYSCNALLFTNCFWQKTSFSYSWCINVANHQPFLCDVSPYRGIEQIFVFKIVNFIFWS